MRIIRFPGIELCPDFCSGRVFGAYAVAIDLDTAFALSDRLDPVGRMPGTDKGFAVINNQIADVELIRLLIQSNFYGEAEEAYTNAMDNHKSDIRKSITAQVGLSISEIRDLIASDKAFDRKIKLNSDG